MAELVWRRDGESAKDDLLTTVSTQNTRAHSLDLDIRTNVGRERIKGETKTTFVDAKSPRDALQILRSELDTETLKNTLQCLLHSPQRPPWNFSLNDTGPLQAQIVNALLSNIVPNFWPVLRENERSLLKSCFVNVTGVASIIGRLKQLTMQAKVQKPGPLVQQISDLIALLGSVLEGSSHIYDVCIGLSAAAAGPKRELAWKDYVSLVGSGKLTTVVAQALDADREQRSPSKKSWLSQGKDYAQWLGENIGTLTTQGLHQSAGELLARSLSIGYSITLLESLIRNVIRHDREPEETARITHLLLQCIPDGSQRQLNDHMIKWLSHLSTGDSALSSTNQNDVQSRVSAIAGMIEIVFKAHAVYQQCTLSLLSDPVVCSWMSLSSRRASVAVTSNKAADELHDLLERLTGTFGDKLFINHAPLGQQETLTQNLLLVAGYLYRKTPIALRMTARSSRHTQGISNRLDASNHRARWLGMVVGTAMSALVDKEGSKMSFGTDDMQTDEVQQYIGLTQLEDSIGTINDLKCILQGQTESSATASGVSKSRSEVEGLKMPVISGKPVFGPPRPPEPVQTEVRGAKVTEIFDDESSDDDDDLKPYAKPDSDPEDSDEDATLVNRNKSRPPVYIRDLMAMLRDNENHDRFQMGIKHAATLIRRKKGFGREVNDHAEELARIFCSLQDPFDTEDFDELRLQALIAVVLCDVTVVAPWLSRQAFAGEYSLAQRCVMLSAIGLAGRELAGFKNEDELNPLLCGVDFPSRRLPNRLHAIYAPADSSLKRLEAATRGAERDIIQPMALQAADRSTSHLDAVKVRKFSSRPDVERTRRKPAANQLAKVFGQAFFFPLVGRYQQEIAAYGSGSAYASAPFVLVTFLKTLALLLHASGPATVDLPQVAGEYWSFLLSLRVQATSDVTIMEAVLFSLLTLLEVSSDKRRLAEEHPKELVETKEWVDMIFERTGGGGLIIEGGNDDSKVRTLAAGVLMRTGEVITAYQKLLIGTDLEY